MQIDDARIYYEMAGNPSGPSLVFLHGGLGNITDFNSVLDSFLADFRCIGIDFRGHGKSTIGSAKLTYQQHQTDVETVLAHAGIDSCSLLGFSDGGTTAYRIAIKNPLKIKAIATIGAKYRCDASDPVFPLLQGMTSEKWEQRFPESVAYYHSTNPAPDFDALVNAVVSLWTDPGDSGYPGDAIEQIVAPALILRGDRDHLFTLKAAVDLLGHLKGANFFNIPFAGHEAHRESGPCFSMVVQDFLANPEKT